MMDWNIAIKIGSFVVAAIGVGLGAIKWVMDRHQRYVTAQFDELRGDIDRHKSADMDEHVAMLERITGHETRITRAEQDIKNNPGHHDIGRVFRRIEDVRGEMKEISGAMKSLTRSVDMINEHLINKEKSR